MIIRHVNMASCADATGAVVVIDVLRAFTTAAYAFAAGASEILAVDSAESARSIRKRYPGAVTIGALGGGMPIPDFDFGNSPSTVAGCAFRGDRLIHCTAGGVRALERCRDAEWLFAASLVCAQATATYLRCLAPAEVTLVVTGEWVDRDGDEDRACAEYLEELLLGRSPDPRPFVERVRRSDFGRRFGDAAYPALPAADLDHAAVADRFAFAMPVGRIEDVLVMRPTAMPPAAHEEHLAAAREG
jgi:2-phosphosulfolactate phosphatase